MSKLSGDAARLDSLRKSFTVIMWALVFFLPLPIPILNVRPDVLAWLLLLIGVGTAVRHLAGLGPLWATAAAGMALSVVRILVDCMEAEADSLPAIVLHACMWALVAAFMVQLSALVRRLAAEMDADDVAGGAAWRGWTPLLPLAFFTALPFVPEKANLLFGCAALLAALCAVLFAMGVPAGAARMFAHAVTQATQEGSAEPEEPGEPEAPEA
jgi:hypothetical protein